jgi:HPt (histidine-containing phosphotransfer) domain-containing protein
MEKAINSEALDELRSLMGESLNEVLQTFIDYVPDQINELSMAVFNNDADGVFNLAHKMKSSSSSIGALGLAQTAEQIEMIGRAGSTEGAAELLEQLKGMYSDAEVLLRKELNR